MLDVLRQGAKVGQPIILFRTSNTDPAEDFVPSIQGTTADFYAAGLVSAAVALHYGCIPGSNFPNCVGGIHGAIPDTDDPAFEIEYAPFGVDSGLCVGVAATATPGRGRHPPAVWRLVQDGLDRDDQRLAGHRCATVTCR